MRLVCRLQQRVRTLEATHISHHTRVRHLPCDADAVSKLIQVQLVEQGQLSALLCPPAASDASEADGHMAALFAAQLDLRHVLVSPAMLDEWNTDLQLVEDAMAAPFRPGADSTICVDADAAERVCVCAAEEARVLAAPPDCRSESC